MSEDDLIRILSIHSHVVHGYVGNRSATFPLQLLGFDVDVINSVQFCNHTWYDVWQGQVLDDKDLDKLFEGLKANNLQKYDYVITGYIGSDSFLRKVNEVIRELKVVNPNIKYVCDPVMGDAGFMYVPETLLDIYRTETVPLADIVLPNQWEAEKLLDMTAKTEADCKQLLTGLHALGPTTVVLSSSDVGATDKMIGFASQIKDGCCSRVRMDIPKLEAQFVGTGDLFAALWLAWSHRHPSELALVATKVQSTMQHILARTHKAAIKAAGRMAPSFAQLELRLVQSKHDIEDPQLCAQVEVIPKDEDE